MWTGSGQRLAGAALAVAIAACAALSGQTTPANGQKPKAAVRDAAQPEPAGTGAIAGTLVAADTGRPVRRAKVTLVSREPSVTRMAATDVNGRFVFTALPAAAFTLSASQPGYLDVTYGQKRPGAGGLGTPIQLADHQRLETITLRMPRGGVLTGTVLDENGDVAFGVQIRALRYVLRMGERTLEASGTARSDDRGVYRIPALPPGDYLVTATPREAMTSPTQADPTPAKATPAAKPARAARETTPADSPQPDAEPPDGYAPVFYPGTTTPANAVPITIDVSQERAAIDLQLQLVPMARVSGTLTPPGGALPPNAQIQLTETGPVPIGRSARTARVSATGAFAFTAIPPGRYTLTAQLALPRPDSAAAPAAPGAVGRGGGATAAATARKAAKAAGEIETYWAMSDITIDGHDLSNVTLALQPGLTVSGRLVYRGARAQPSDATRVRVTMTPVEGSAASDLATKPAVVNADGTFAITGVAPGSYRIAIAGQAGPAGWTLASAVVAGRDALDDSLHVRPGEDVANVTLTLTDRQTEVSGTLQDASGLGTSDYSVVIFAADPAFWTPRSRRIQAARPGTDGRFTFRALPPGEYRAVALTDIEPGGWFDPALLAQLAPLAIPLTLGEGAKIVQDLRIK